MHWLSIAEKYHPIQFDTSLVPPIACLRLVESKLIAVARLFGLVAPTREALVVRRKLAGSVQRDLVYCTGLVKRMPIAKPRLLIMQAYWAAIRGQRASCRTLLEHSIALCRDMQDLMELERATKNRDAWLGVGTREAVDIESARYWSDERAMTLMPRFTEVEDGKCKTNLLYALPLFRAMRLGSK